MKTLETQDVLVEQVPVKCLEMPDVKEDAVTLWNRPFVDGVRTYYAEECVTSAASIGDPLQQLTTDCDLYLSSEHWASCLLIGCCSMATGV
jgi:hypothetical protein